MEWLAQLAKSLLLLLLSRRRAEWSLALGWCQLGADPLAIALSALFSAELLPSDVCDTPPVLPRRLSVSPLLHGPLK